MLSKSNYQTYPRLTLDKNIDFDAHFFKDLCILLLMSASPSWLRLVTPERRSFWANRNVFVTGGFGLLGSTIVELLHLMGARVTVLKRDHSSSSRLFELPAYKDLNVAPGDLDDYNSLYRIIAEYEIDTVFHLGAQPIAPVGNRAPLPTLKTNIMGTANLLEACRVNPTVKRVMVASSDKAYGAQPVLPYTEEAPLQGRHPYDVSKSCTDLLAQMYYHTYKLPVAITRCGNLYGPGDLNWQRIVPETFKHVVHNEAPLIRSDGKFIRDYFFVRDAANAYVTLAENMERPEVVGQAFNFSTGNGKTVLDIVDTILKAGGRSDLQPKVLNEAKAEIHDQTLSSEKAWRVLGWKPVFTLEEGMAETFAWYRDYFASRKAAREAVLAPLAAIDALEASKTQADLTSKTFLPEVTPIGIHAVPPAATTVSVARQTPIDGVTLTPLKIIADDRGQIMHMLRQDTPGFDGKFGEVYFTGVYQGAAKGWNLHTRAWSNWSVPNGRVKVALFDTRENSPTRGQGFELILGDHNYQLLTIPPGVAAAWKGVAAGMSMVANVSSEMHDPNEGKKLPLETYPHTF